MAGQAAAKKNGEQQAPAAPPAPPKGFKRITSVSNAPWVKAKQGNVIHGKLINRFPLQGQDRFYYQVELFADCIVSVGRGEDAEETTAKPGDVVNLNENHKAQELCEQVIPEIIAGAEYDIWACYMDKIALSGGRSMWNLDIHTSKKKPPTSQVVPLKATGTPSEDEAPF